ncbi:MAG: YggT family protein [Deltaproteobacteria bacterium]|nr:YggT family protein [Deltaproteobacteria bacterium]
MILIANLLIGIAQLLSSLITIFIILFIARAILSWVSPDPYNPIVRFINNCTDPILYRVRQKMPPLGMFDLSVLVVILLLYFAQMVICQSLLEYGEVLKHSVLPVLPLQ